MVLTRPRACCTPLATPPISLPPRTMPRAATVPLCSPAQFFRAVVICSVSKPSMKPSIKAPPMAFPSEIAPPVSMPRSASSPAVMPLPMVLPKSPIIPVIFALPDPFHHSLKGSATILSQAILSLPQMSALAQSSPLVKSAIVSLSHLTLPSMKSRALPAAFSTSGILLVMNCTNCRK